MKLNMNLFVSALMLLLAASQIQSSPVPGPGEEQVQENGEEQVQENGEEQVQDNGEEQVQENGEEQVQENGEEQVQDNGEEQVQDNGGEQVQDSEEEQVQENGEEQVQENGEEQVQDNGEEQVQENGEEQVQDNGGEPVTDNGEEQVQDHGEEQVQENGEEQVQDNGEEQVQDNGGEQGTDNGEEQGTDNGEEQGTEEAQSEDISTGILSSNKKSPEFLLEGDIEAPKTRNAMKCWSNSCRWPKGSDGKVSIPYTVSRQYSPKDKQQISSALAEIESKTCVRFVPRQNQKDYVSVESKSGCYSHLGRQGGRQVLSLRRRGCVYKGIIQHEFLHSLGFKHEQTRSDRDKYVRINWDNMDRDQAYNFYKFNTNNQNTPYDYESIMHYGRKAFSTNGRDTITPLSSTVTIGQRQGPSHWDLQRINLLYSC